jgi:hypothetical protein
MKSVRLTGLASRHLISRILSNLPCVTHMYLDSIHVFDDVLPHPPSYSIPLTELITYLHGLPDALTQSYGIHGHCNHINYLCHERLPALQHLRITSKGPRETRNLGFVESHDQPRYAAWARLLRLVKPQLHSFVFEHGTSPLEEDTSPFILRCGGSPLPQSLRPMDVLFLRELLPVIVQGGKDSWPSLRRLELRGLKRWRSSVIRDRDITEEDRRAVGEDLIETEPCYDRAHSGKILGWKWHRTRWPLPESKKERIRQAVGSNCICVFEEEARDWYEHSWGITGIPGFLRL